MKLFRLVIILAGNFLFAANNMHAQECPPDNCSFARECESAPELKWVSASGSHGGVAVSVSGGHGPYTWAVGGQGFYFDYQGNNTQKKVSPAMTEILYKEGSGCFADLTVTDSCCQKVEQTVEVPALHIDEANSDEELVANSNGACAGTVTVLGGVGPYTWTINGAGFWFDQAGTMTTLDPGSSTAPIYTFNACGTATITVTDGCSSATWVVKSMDGDWETVYESAAGIDGDHLGIEAYPGGCPTTLDVPGSVDSWNSVKTTSNQVEHQGVRVTQYFEMTTIRQENFSSFNDAVQFCESATSPEPSERFTGSCFNYTRADDFRPCGGNTTNLMGGTFEPGKSSNIALVTMTSYYRFSYLTKTIVDEWQCNQSQ